MKEIPVIILGVGGVGRTLIEQLIKSRDVVAARNGTTFNVVAVADSKHWFFVPEGLTDSELSTIVARKAAGEPIGESPRPADLVKMVEMVHAAGVRKAILVDVTAIGGMEPAMDRALELGYGLALANKKAMAGPWETAQNYYNNRYVRFESTVGGGQPVVATLRYLGDIKDDFYTLEGQLSGTLGFIAQALESGKPFSEALTEAKAKGFTEPDPRDDLSGEDVMRKVLIMGRMAGWPLEAKDIEVESLYDAALADLSVPDFMAAASGMDAGLAERFTTAAANGEKLRYIGRVTAQGGKVGLSALPAASPLANLKYIQFHTRLYDVEPMLICGAGAGLGMTAGGVLGDMIGLARENY